MIGKIMSEAAHSIIGMFSAKPLHMENNASNSDFGSLMRVPEEQRHSVSRGMELDTADAEDIDPVLAQNWEATNVLPIINHSFGNAIFNREQSAGKIEGDQTTDDNIDGRLVSDRLNRQAIESGSKPYGQTVMSEQDNAGFAGSDRLQSDQSREALGRNDLRNLQSQKSEDFQLQPEVLGNRSANSVFPTSDKALLKLQSLQAELSDGSGASKPELASLLAKSEPGSSGSRGSRRDANAGATSNLQGPISPDREFIEPVKFDMQSAIKTAETSIEQQPFANSMANLAVRETSHKPVSFNMAAPQFAERLAAEIADISSTGGTKSFEINPRNLGRMEIIFTTRGSSEIIEIQTEHRAAKDIIVQHSQVLQEMLKSQGRDDLTFRVDVKENMVSSSRTDDANLSRQENGDAQQHRSSPSQSTGLAPSSDNSTENEPLSDNGRYA